MIPGTIGRFDSSAGGIRVPHIGWNALQVGNDSDILDDVGNRHVYFVHSYRAIPVLISIISSFFLLSSFHNFFFGLQSNENKDWVSSTCHYGESFISSIRRGNVHAVQFHPEKSGGMMFYSSYFVLDIFIYLSSTILIQNLDICRGGSFCFEKVLGSKIILETGRFHFSRSCTT